MRCDRVTSAANWCSVAILSCRKLGFLLQCNCSGGLGVHKCDASGSGPYKHQAGGCEIMQSEDTCLAYGRSRFHSKAPCMVPSTARLIPVYRARTRP